MFVLGENVFLRTESVDKPGLSTDDRKFLDIMEKGFYKTEEGNWSAPLPFRDRDIKIPRNKPQAEKRAKTLESSLHRDPLKTEHFFEFMQGILDSEHAEKAPPITEERECWYLPIFGVYHPRKPNQLRAVFDSSAKYRGISLNDTFYTGPDLTNSLLGILF